MRLAIVSKEDSESVKIVDGRWLAVRIHMAIVSASSSGVYEEMQPMSWTSLTLRVKIGRHRREESRTTMLAWALRWSTLGRKMPSSDDTSAYELSVKYVG